MIATAIASKLADFVVEIAEAIFVEQFLQSQRKRISGVIVTEMKAVFAARRPLRRDADSMANLGAGALRDGLESDIVPDLSALARRPLPAAGARGQTLADRLDQRAADIAIRPPRPADPTATGSSST